MLHAREEIVFELLRHLRGDATRQLLEQLRKNTRGSIEEQEAVFGRLFTIQNMMQSTVYAWLQVWVKSSKYCIVIYKSWVILPGLNVSSLNLLMGNAFDNAYSLVRRSFWYYFVNGLWLGNLIVLFSRRVVFFTRCGC